VHLKLWSYCCNQPCRFRINGWSAVQYIHFLPVYNCNIAGGSSNQLFSRLRLYFLNCRKTLTSKPVQILLPVTNGGTGNATLTDGNILVGSGTDPIKARVLASADTSIQIIQTADSIILKSKFTAEEVTSDPGCHTQCYRRSGKFGYECECQGVCCSLRSPS
jgi:hypothetical protein